MNNNTNELANVSIGKLMWKYFVPAFVGVVAYSLYNIVDRIFIGQKLGALALSGVSVIFPIMMIFMAFGLLIGIGSSVQISLYLGKNHFEKANKVLGNSIILSFICAVIILILGFLIKEPMLEIFGATEQTIAYADSYLNIILFGIIFQFLGYALNNIIRAEGSARTAMYSMLISAGSNIILDYIFIYILDLGVAGAAYATIISMAILSIWVLLHFLSPRSVVKLTRDSLRFDLSILKPIIAIGMAPFIMNMASSVVQAIYNLKLIKFGGDVAVGAMGVINSVIMLIVMMIVALNMAAQPIIGYNYGAKAYGRVLKTVKLSIYYGSAIAFVAWLGIMFFPRTIVAAFNSTDKQLLDMGSNGLRIDLLMLPIIGFQVVMSNYFQSIGKAKIAAISTIARQVVVLIPMLLVLPRFFDLNGIWAAAPVADFLSAILVLVFMYNEWKQMSPLLKKTS